MAPAIIFSFWCLTHDKQRALTGAASGECARIHILTARVQPRKMSRAQVSNLLPATGVVAGMDAEADMGVLIMLAFRFAHVLGR